MLSFFSNIPPACVGKLRATHWRKGRGEEKERENFLDRTTDFHVVIEGSVLSVADGETGKYLISV